MTLSLSAIFASEVVDCMSEGRDPTVRELFSVAVRIWSESAAERSAFAWGTLSETAPERLAALNAAA
ncbi:MAG: hypothetical protein JWM75_2582 [Sphingomonas bacterium]|nr:hypothetical protein [Sphingomonas bacterium]